MKQPRDLRTTELADGTGPRPALAGPDSSPPPSAAPRPAAPSPSRRSVVLGAAAAVLVVALAASLFATLAARQGSPAAPPARTAQAASPTATIGVAGQVLKGALPSGVEVLAFAPVGDDEGWATGAIGLGAVTSIPREGVILRYAKGAWTQVGAALPSVRLGGLTMATDADGWALGVDDQGRAVMLRITGGAWQRVAPPPAADPRGALAGMRLRAPDDGWLVVANPKGGDGLANTSLLHYDGGAWTPVRTPLLWITDLAPIGADEAWVVGRLPNGAGAAIAHVRGAATTVALTASGSADLYHLRALSPTDVWADGARHAADFNDAEDVALLYHYDGGAWRPADLRAPQGAQRIQVTAAGEAWATISVNPEQSRIHPTPDVEVAAVYALRAGQWGRVAIPYADLTALDPLASARGGLWAMGSYLRYTQTSANTSAGVGHTVLLRYADGTWTEYGR